MSGSGVKRLPHSGVGFRVVLITGLGSLGRSLSLEEGNIDLCVMISSSEISQTSLHTNDHTPAF